MSDSRSCSSSSTGADDDQNWDDWEEEGDGELPVKSLFSETVLPSAEAAFAHDAQHYGFDIRQFKAQVCLRKLSVLFWHRTAGRRPLAVKALVR